MNETTRSGQHYTTPRKLGPARVDLTHALRLAAELEDDALARHLRRRLPG